MRTLSQLPVPQDNDPKFPFSTIKNETDTEDGTPVVRELYGDHITNNYKLLEVTGITPNGVEDSEDEGYQILQALQALPNSHNDIEQILEKSGTVFSVDLKLSILPDKYIFFARAADTYISGPVYTFKGSEVTSYPFSTPTGFSSLDELIIVVDHSGVRAYSITKLTSASNEVFPSLGLPISFNSTDKLYYQDAGVLMSDVPSVEYLENTIRADSGEGTLIILDILILKGFVLCFCVIDTSYVFYQFDLLDFSTSIAVPVTGITFDDADEFSPYIYTDGNSLFVTNNCNNDVEDYKFTSLSYTPATPVISLVSQFEIDNSFVKTSNAAIKSNVLYTYIDGAYNSFALPAGTKTEIGIFPGVIGSLFNFNGGVYFSTGQVAKKWL